MSVYTQVTTNDLQQVLTDYNIGGARRLEGISEGIENTNYYLTTDKGRYVLTLFEQLRESELPFFMTIMNFYAGNDIPSADPIATRTGGFLFRIRGLPAAIVSCLPGKTIKGQPTLEQSSQLGHYLGKMHKLAPQLQVSRPPERNHQWWQQTAQRVMPHLPSIEQELLCSELEFQQGQDFMAAPSGVIHADLFRDNALFVGNELTGILDFYYACNWPFIYDLAVVVNDWCCTGDPDGDRQMAKVIFEAYSQQRQLQAVEQELWPVALRAAALRFWLSRMQDKQFPRAGHLTHIKKPDVFRDILQRNRQQWIGWPLA